MAGASSPTTSPTPADIAPTSTATTPTACGASGREETPSLAAEPAPAKSRCSPSWARLIAKVYQADPLVCRRCGGPLKVVAYITDELSITRILDHLGLSPPPQEKPPPDPGGDPRAGRRGGARDPGRPRTAPSRPPWISTQRGRVPLTRDWAMSRSTPDSRGAPDSRQPHSSLPGGGVEGVGSSSLPLDRPPRRRRRG